MRTSLPVALAVCTILNTAAAQHPASAPATTVITRQQIAAILKQTLPEAPHEGGGGLFDGPTYRIGALRRGLPGEAEIHRKDTDIIYVLSGSATLVTGGVVTAKHTTSANEERGSALTNGIRHTLNPGDMVIIPRNEPHWFQAISAEVSYLVIKVQ